ncbi:Lhr family helicase [Corynebacterium propinquum]|uniref:Lhr family helicase n=1 Tax=Corynebacterium propinquum TaxID=43769 RepID=UPI00201BBE61|nr:DEAD/DEAH box helicase [Corynebacterium propinquum]UQV60883.1 DEAD/DEAH box helicase [Corynebacterium propinquum]
MSDDVLSRFSPPVASWFREVFAQPTDVQRQAWQAVSEGKNALVVAPTGSGKTLAAFLWVLNGLSTAGGQLTLPVADTKTSLADADKPGGSETPGKADEPDGASKSGIAAKPGVTVLYISPLKALGVDVERNLHAPLTGIGRVAQRMGHDVPSVSVGVRSGDTPQAERARQLRRPPDILITTPESAYLMLTGKAAGILSTVTTVIVDEIHALAGSKRGVHLALTLERLARVAGDPQRIGLSATVRPIETVAQFLGGDREVEIVAPPAKKSWELAVRVPVDNMADLPVPEQASTIGEMTVGDPLGLSSGGAPGAGNGAADNGAAGAGEETPSFASDSALPTAKSIWPHIEAELYQTIMGQNSTLVFVNSRRTAERLTSRINELYAAEHAPELLSAPTRRDPAQLMKHTDTAGAAASVIARAHHGSVSKDERAQTESLLKQGALKAVVATSSLELGIDMGAVDQVVQVESPPSVASALQRVGRAGHSVGAVSRGDFYPKHRADLVQTAVTVGRVQPGLIEKIHVPRNPLDVLVQQTIAAVAVEDLDVDEWFSTICRAYPYRDLDRDVYDSVLDLASGIYPSTDFAELKPRIVVDRVDNTLSARPGSQRVAVTSGGTIPDRGMFGVFLAGTTGDSTGAAGTGASGAGKPIPRRVGELDEEMVYESRVGDVFTLGASSWRIEDITRDQVLVTPAPGHTGRLPFWSGDQLGRPYELGLALGAFRRHAHRERDKALADLPLEERARTNLLGYLDEQYESTGLIPDEKTLVLERFRDELGDWRVVLHTPFGRGVNAAWALAVGARIAENTGMDAQAVAGDDGIVLRVPEGDHDPDASLFIFDDDEIEEIVTTQVGNSALFASRFRECAARALLLPRYDPGKRAPLWQQRQKAEQLLDVARKYPSFPIILETVRECLQDVYDLPALHEVTRSIAQRTIRIAEVTTEQPSPFSSSLLFNYTGAFMYEGDSPLAEKRAAALSLDPSLLAKLLGTVELRELLDPDVIVEVHQALQHTTPERRAHTAEQLADILRRIGPIPVDQLAEHAEISLEQAQRELGARVMVLRMVGHDHLAQSNDAALLRDGLGIPVPPGIPAQTETIDDALAQLLKRWARSRGPFVLRDAADAFGISISSAWHIVQTLSGSGELVEGHYRQGIDELEYCAAGVLKRIRSRSLAAARKALRPVSASGFARFLLSWHQITDAPSELGGEDAVFAAIEQLAGVRLPASAWEQLVLPARVPGYSPRFLDELTNNGEVLIRGVGQAGRNDPWIMLLPAEYAAQLAPLDDASSDTSGLTHVQEAIVMVLSNGGGYLFADIVEQVNRAGTLSFDDHSAHSTPAPQQFTSETVRAALWELVDLGMVSPDSFAPLRTRLAGGASRAHKAKRQPRRSRLRMGRTSFATSQHARSGQSTPPDMVGRWALTVQPDRDATARSVAQGEAWLDRYGVLTRGSVVAEDVTGGFALAYKVLSEFEAAGKAQRGYFVEGLGAAQFSTPSVVDRLRGADDAPDVHGWPSGTTDPDVVVLAATDPANPYGAALDWPQADGAGDSADSGESGAARTGSRPARSAGSLVVLADGLCLAHLSRGGKTLTTFFDALPEGIDADPAQLLVDAVHAALDAEWIRPLTIEKANGAAILGTPLALAMRKYGAKLSPKGLRLSR